MRGSVLKRGKTCTGTWADPGRQTAGDFLEEWLTAVTPSVDDLSSRP